MSWNDFYRRRDAIDTVLATAARRRTPALPYHELPAVRAAFASREELLSALQYKWQRALSAQIDLALTEADDDPSVDRFDLLRNAWQAATKRGPTLRAILDEHAGDPAIQEQVDNERRQLAHLAGLTGPGDTEEDAAALGGTFLALVHAGPQQRHGRGSGGLLRKLVGAASA